MRSQCSVPAHWVGWGGCWGFCTLPPIIEISLLLLWPFSSFISNKSRKLKNNASTEGGFSARGGGGGVFFHYKHLALLILHTIHAAECVRHSSVPLCNLWPVNMDALSRSGIRGKLESWGTVAKRCREEICAGHGGVCVCNVCVRSCLCVCVSDGIPILMGT